jgi:hypothetical protein
VHDHLLELPHIGAGFREVRGLELQRNVFDDQPDVPVSAVLSYGVQIEDAGINVLPLAETRAAGALTLAA